MSNPTNYMRECTLTRANTTSIKTMWLSEDNAQQGKVVNFKEEDFQIDWIITTVSSHRSTTHDLARQHI